MDSIEKNDGGSTEDDLQDQIAAYFGGEMTPKEAAAFERLVETNEALRRQVDEWRDAFEAARDWMGAGAPGVERVETLAIPIVATRRSRRVWLNALIRSYAWRGVAATAIFVLGFVVGFTWHPQVSPPGDREGIKSTELSPPVDRGEIKRGVDLPHTVGETTETAPAAPQAKEAVEFAQLPALRHSVDEKGRIIIETGTHALWVIDGGFQIAQISLSTKGGKP